VQQGKRGEQHADNKGTHPDATKSSASNMPLLKTRIDTCFVHHVHHHGDWAGGP
jgi:hypothetical protein